MIAERTCPIGRKRLKGGESQETSKAGGWGRKSKELKVKEDAEKEKED